MLASWLAQTKAGVSVRARADAVVNAQGVELKAGRHLRPAFDPARERRRQWRRGCCALRVFVPISVLDPDGGGCACLAFGVYTYERLRCVEGKMRAL